MSRTLISDTVSQVGQTVTIRGWLQSLRLHGQIAFADIRDRSGLIQVVGTKALLDHPLESALSLTGKVTGRDPRYFNPKIATGQVEIQVESVEVLSPSQTLPYDVHSPDLSVSLPILLDNRPASLKNQKILDVFRVQATIVAAFRQYLADHGFTEFQAPTIVPGTSEGGSEMFSIDYFGRQAFLAQSPQLYKQVMVNAFERVFTVAHAYRAEPSVTTRHLTEYVGLDVELGFIDSWTDVIDVADGVVKYIFDQVKLHHQSVLDEYGVTLPQTVAQTPTIKLRQALEIISQRSGRDVRNELDLDPEGEKEICRYAQEKFNSDLIFVTHFYTKKRAWYSQVDPDNPDETLTFDLIGKGVEWISGGQRIHNFDTLLAKIKTVGLDPAAFENPYIQSFRYGMPPEGGFCIGLERITQNILGLANLRQASLFPRDMDRVDGKLTQDDPSQVQEK